jgi:protein ImuA
MQPQINTSRAERIARAAALIRSDFRQEDAVRICASTGVAEIDAALPWGGVPCGLHEVASAMGDGAKTGFAARLIAGQSGPILWCRSRRTVLEGGDPYGPGMSALGISPDRLILVDTSRQADLLWAMEEGARTKGLAAVVAEGAAPDLTTGRRLQLAAEAGNGLVLLLQSGRQAMPSSALTRWFVASAPSLPEADGPGRPCWTLELWRCRGGRPRDWMVEWNDAALSLSVVPQMADRLPAAADGHSARPPGPDGERPGWHPPDRDRQVGGAVGADRRDDIGRRAGAAA